MSKDLNKQFHEIPLELENQDLKEIIEIGSQITAQLDIENIIRNVVLSFFAKFQAESVTVMLPNDFNEDQVNLFHYQGLKKKEIPLNIPSISPIINFLEQDEYNQISFSYFLDNYRDLQVIEEFKKIKPDIIIPLRTDKGVTGLVLLPRSRNGSDYSLLDIQYITQIIRFASIAIENANLYWQATIDRMTKLFSHHYLMKNLDDEITRAHRYNTTFTLIMLDIDHFKKFNDTYGHLQGDIIIKEIAKILRNSVRKIDFPARYGGEEFTLILPEVNVEGAVIVAERLRKKIENHPFPSDEGSLHVTISIGIAEFNPNRMRLPSQIIAEADKALYQSKEFGRNRVTVLKKTLKS